jgi:hypothetical protein
MFDKIIASDFIAPVRGIWESETEEQNFHDCCSPYIEAQFFMENWVSELT